MAAPIVLLLVVAAGQFVSAAGDVRMPSLGQSGDRADQLQDHIDPNVAPWWELTILPGVGEVTARSIVEYRGQAQADVNARPFKIAYDLENVRGIGPKTVERLGPLLRFDSGGESAIAPIPSAPPQSEGR